MFQGINSVSLQRKDVDGQFSKKKKAQMDLFLKKKTEYSKNKQY